MDIKRLRSRIEHLEQRTNGGECGACARTAFEQMEVEGDPSLTAPTCCPDCGNPNPRIPLRVMDALVADEEKVRRLEKVLRERLRIKHAAKAKAKAGQRAGNE